jgi:F420-non-reducing hydrogenase iron-sulfur subunit
VEQLLFAAAPRTKTRTKVIAFVCANCGREGMEATTRLGQPRTPAMGWQEAVQDVVVPCAGRLQPEHLLKAFEAGADLVAVVACEEGNCHFLEGSCRARVRCDYVGGLLDQIGLGRERLMLLHLPGSAREDMAVGSPAAKGIDGKSPEEVSAPVDGIAAQVSRRLASLPPNPMRENGKREDIEITEAQEEENED